MQSEQQKSEWNDAMGYTARINWDLIQCKEARYSNNMSLWANSLLSLCGEISPELKKNKVELENSLFEMRDLVQKRINGAQHNGGKPKFPKELYKELDRLEKELRGVIDKAGLLTRRSDDPANALM